MKASLVPVLLASLLIVGCGPYDPKSASELAQCYQHEFNAPPPGTVKVLNARQMVIRDWGAQWLQLQLKEDALEAVLLTNGFTRAKSPPVQFTTVDRYTPDWWRPSPPEAFDYYEHSNWTKGTWGSSRAVLAFDRSRGIAFFRCDRID